MLITLSGLLLYHNKQPTKTKIHIMKNLTLAIKMLKNCKGASKLDKQPKGVLYPIFNSSEYQLLSNNSGTKTYIYLYEQNCIYLALFN